MLLFEGRNGDGRIARAVFSPEGGGPYALDIPASPVFLVSAPVEDTVPTGHISLEAIAFYDSQGRDITDGLRPQRGRHPVGSTPKTKRLTAAERKASLWM